MNTVLITGANRGLGLEFTRQLAEQNNRVIATCREPAKAAFLQQLAKTYPQITVAELDVSDDQSINRLMQVIGDTAIDWLINNAGTVGLRGVVLGNLDRDNFLKVFNINCLGALKVSEALLPNLEKGEDRLIVAISSRLGNISISQYGHVYAYRASKAALNNTMHSLAIDVGAHGIKVMLLHPGWVRTEIGGSNGTIDVETSVSSMLQVIEANKADSHAEVMYNYDGSILPW